MAQTGYTPIALYSSGTASAAPTAGNLVNGELALNYNDGKLFYKDSSGVVQTLATKDTAAGTFTSISDSGNLTFTSTGNRIRGDFSNATVANRVAFQSSTTNGNTAIPFIPNGTGTTSAVFLYNGSDTANASFLNINNSASASAFNSTISGTGTYLPMTFLTGGSERLRIDTSGNVGIGTASPSYKLHAYSTGANIIGSEGTTDASFITRLSGTQGLYVHSTTSISEINELRNVPLSFSTNATERMRIDSTGHLLVNRTTGINNGIVEAKAISSENAFVAQVQTDGNSLFQGFNAAGTPAFVVTGNGTMIATGVYGNTTATAANLVIDSAGNFLRSTSALKYKTDIRDLPSIDINKFRPVVYKSKSDNDDAKKDYFGIISDEVDQAGIKELVNYGADGEVEGFQYERLTVVLLKAMQEQQAIIEELKAKVAALEAAK